MNRKKTVKTATKKAAKKTYPRKKTPPKPRRITLEDLAAVVAETESRIAKSREDLSAVVAESEVRMAKSHENLTAVVAESETRMAKSREETDKALQKLSADIQELTHAVSHVGNDIGELMEFIVIPKIRHAMNATGKHMFKTMETERKFKEIDELGEKKIFTEVDVFLYGETEVMAVETKSHLFTRDVKKHKERLEILRRHEDVVGIEGKKLVGAVVGAIVDEGAKKFALENGLYVVTIREEAEKLDVVEPETCRAW